MIKIDKLLLPWEKDRDYWKRYTLKRNIFYWIHEDDEKYKTRWYEQRYDFNSFQEATNIFDGWLIELGFILIPEDKVEKYKLLI
jgi:hypothetical protein